MVWGRSVLLPLRVRELIFDRFYSCIIQYFGMKFRERFASMLMFLFWLFSTELMSEKKIV